MLKLLWIPENSGKKDLWRAFDPHMQYWVVSDEKTKFFLTQSLLEKVEVISSPVKKAKEFWKELLGDCEPEVKVLEALGTKISAKEYLEEFGKSDWCKRPRAPEKLVEACRHLGSLISHENATEILDQFEQEFKSTAGPFLEISQLAAGFFLSGLARKQIPHFLVPYYLSHRDQPVQLENEIIFDLGFDLRDGEKELIQFLSRVNDITVIIPAENKESLESRSLHAYKDFDLGVANISEEKVTRNKSSKSKIDLWRCSSPEAEARQAVEQVQKWISEGVKPESICITSAQMNNYEDILAHDLAWEGLGFQRNLKTPVAACRHFRALSARLRIMKGDISGQNLEEAFLTVSQYRHQTQRREERRILQPVVEESQITQKDIQNQVEKIREKRPSKPVSIRKFEDILIDLFSEITAGLAVDSQFISALQKLKGEIGERTLEFRLWVEAWQEITAQMKVGSEVSAESGVWGVDLAHCEEIPSEHLIVLGCTEGRTHSNVVNGLDREKLVYLAQLGFDLSPPLRNKNDILIDWLISDSKKRVILSCAKTDSQGRSVGASPFWIKRATVEGRNLDVLNTAHETQWIRLQKTVLSENTSEQIDYFKNWPSKNSQGIGTRLLEDLNGTRKVNLPESHARPLDLRISASQIEAYWECPYKFYSRTHLKLFDGGDLEVEPTPLARGQWIHSAVEIILKDTKELKDWSEENLIGLIDGLDHVQKQVSSDIWPNIRSRFLRQLKRFIEFEMDWQKTYSRVKPHSFESPVQGFLAWRDSNSKVEFLKEKPTDSNLFWVPFKGRVDRIDSTDDQKLIIVDYKSSAGATDNILSWVRNGSFQLALYSSAIESGLLDGEPKDVIAAQYFILKKLDRERGFKRGDIDLNYILPEKKSKAQVDLKTRDEVFTQLGIQVSSILESIRKGEMTPKPHNEKICERCSWRISCRAPHLD